MERYVYCPYHPWRHGWRRERRRKVCRIFLKMGLAGGLLLLSGNYVKMHTEEYVFERESEGEDALGFGIDESGEFFFFRRKFF